MKKADDIIKHIRDFSDSVMQEKYRDKPTISINEAWKMIDEARKDAIEECAKSAKIIRYNPDPFQIEMSALGSTQQDQIDKSSILDLIKKLS